MVGSQSGKEHYVVQGKRWILHGEEGQDAGFRNKIKECTTHETAAPKTLRVLFQETLAQLLQRRQIFISEPSQILRPGNIPIQKAKVPSGKERETTPEELTIPLPRNIPMISVAKELGRTVYWILPDFTKGNQRLRSIFSKVAQLVIFLQGATGLTVNLDYWEGLAAAHSKIAIPTKVVIFETELTALVVGDPSYQSIGGGYFACEHDPGLIGRYIREGNASAQYAALLDYWRNADENRAQARQVSKLRAQIEGKGGGQ